MKVYILFNDFEFKIERVSCDGQKINEMADEYNGPDCFGPYTVIDMELEDVPPIYTDICTCKKISRAIECDLYKGSKCLYEPCIKYKGE